MDDRLFSTRIFRQDSDVWVVGIANLDTHNSS